MRREIKEVVKHIKVLEGNQSKPCLKCKNLERQVESSVPTSKVEEYMLKLKAAETEIEALKKKMSSQDNRSVANSIKLKEAQQSLDKQITNNAQRNLAIQELTTEKENLKENIDDLQAELDSANELIKEAYLRETKLKV